jgi:hypothetical protein
VGDGAGYGSWALTWALTWVRTRLRFWAETATDTDMTEGTQSTSNSKQQQQAHTTTLHTNRST